ncbi:MAG: hypothetical protein MZV65_13345 [Chromatiales bacterium]|nr:hypothetical protein [Chromatiales bacterium]
MLGTRQTGEQAFHIADLVRDQQLLPRIEHAAQLLLEKLPGPRHAAHPPLARHARALRRGVSGTLPAVC